MGIFTYIWYKKQPNVGKYTIHGWYGIFYKQQQELVIKSFRYYRHRKGKETIFKKIAREKIWSQQFLPNAGTFRGH